MIKRDYLQRLIEEFSKEVSISLREALINKDPDAIDATEDQIGKVLDLDAQTVLSLSPESFVTMVTLGGTGEALSTHIAYALNRIADGYSRQITSDLSEDERAELQSVATLRRQQAQALLAAFDQHASGVPNSLKDLDRELEDALRAW